MTKQEYMDSVKAKLASCSDEFSSDILSAFEEHFEEGRSQGKTDEEIIEELGSVDSVLNDLTEFGRFEEDSARTAEDKSHGADSEEENQGSSSSEGEYSSHNNKKDHHSKIDFDFDFDFDFDNLGSTITRIVHDDVMQNMKKVLRETMRFGGKQGKKFYRSGTDEEIISQDEISDLEGISDLAVDGSSLDVKIKEGDGLRYTYTHPATAADIVALKQGSVIRLCRRSEDESLKGIVSKGLAGVLEITVPSSISRIKIANGSGDVDAFNLSPSRLIVNTGAGDLSIRACKPGNLDIKSGTGDLTIQESGISYLNIEAGTGDIDVDSSVQSMSVKTASGDIRISSVGQVENYDISSASGDVTLQLKDSEFVIHHKTVMGDIETGYEVNKEGSMNVIRNGVKGTVNVRIITGDLIVK